MLQLQNNTQALNTNSNGVLQLVQQVITPTGEIQHIPVSFFKKRRLKENNFFKE